MQCRRTLRWLGRGITTYCCDDDRYQGPPGGCLGSKDDQLAMDQYSEVEKL
jgi:hypothetical protein